MNPPASNAPAAVLWTGGKDSALALHEARRGGLRVDYLVTFAPPEPDFLAHPLAVMKLQAQALDLPHIICPVTMPFAEGYETALRQLKQNLDIETVITGDIAEVGGSPNWIRERSRPTGMNVLTPLWGRDRLSLLQEMLAAGFQIVMSCVKTPWLTAAWAGRLLNQPAIAELQAIRQQNGLDLCGEEGEYHTLVIDTPDFKSRIQLGDFEVRTRDTMAWLKILQPTLQPKP